MESTLQRVREQLQEGGIDFDTEIIEIVANYKSSVSDIVEELLTTFKESAKTIPSNTTNTNNNMETNTSSNTNTTTTTTTAATTTNNENIPPLSDTATLAPEAQPDDICASLSFLSVEAADSEPTSEGTVDTLTTLNKLEHPITNSIDELVKIGRALKKTIKTCEQHKQTAASEDDKAQWGKAIGIAESLMSCYRQAHNTECNKYIHAAIGGDEGALKTVKQLYESKLNCSKKNALH